MASDFQIIITSPDGTQRRRLPTASIGSPRWSIERYGGYADFEIPTVLDFKATSLPSILVGDRVEFWYKGARRYRGYITSRAPTEEEPQQLVLQGYGITHLLGNQLCSQRYVFPDQGQDVATVFATFAQKWLIQTKGYGGIRAVQNVSAILVGVTTGALDAWQRLSSDIINDLQKASSNKAVWGARVLNDGSSNPPNQLYFQPFQPTNPPTHTLPVPAANMTQASAETHISDVRTLVFITGGQPIYPQLLHNGNFELPVPNEDPQGTIVLNGSFERGGFKVADNWVLNGGASIESGKSQSPAYVNAFDGNRYAELDNQSGIESIVQLVIALTFTPNHNYLFSFRATKEIDLQVLAGHCLLEILNASGVTIQSFTIPIVPPDDTWTFYSQSFIPAAGAQYRCTFQLDSITAYGGQQGGLCIDNVQFYDNDIVYQEGWILQPQGPAARVNAQNWIYQDTVYDGSYCLYFDVTALDMDGSDLDLRPPDGSRFGCTPGQQIRFGGWFNSVPVSANPYFPKLFMEIDWFNSSNNYIHRDRATYDLAPGARLPGWTYAELVATAPNGATRGNVTVTFRGTGSGLVDCLSVRDAAAPSMGTGNPYLPEGNLVFLIDSASNLLPAGAVYANSDNLYGDSCATLNEPSVLTQADALAIADAYFKSNGVPAIHAPITILNDARIYSPGDTVRLVGRDGPTLTTQILPIVRVSESWDGMLTTTIELDREVPDQTEVERRVALDEIARYGPGGANSGGGGGYAGPSSAAGGGGSNAASTRFQIDPGTPLSGQMIYPLTQSADGNLGLCFSDLGLMTGVVFSGATATLPAGVTPTDFVKFVFVYTY